MAERDPECGAIPPNIGNPVPCHLEPAHGGPHFSTTGCPGSEIRWTDERPMTLTTKDAETLAEALAPAHWPATLRSKLREVDGCWLWQGPVNKHGYGRMYTPHAGMQYVHRMAFALTNGVIPSDTQIDHLCRVRSCVNPDHLEAVSPWENTMRGTGITAVAARQESCKRGHPFTPENTRIDNKRARRCRTCDRLRQRKAAKVAKAEEGDR